MRIDGNNWGTFASPHVHPADWSVVIPAAGKGTRLGYERPKVLYPVAGRMILEWLVDLFLPLVGGQIVFVVSPTGRQEVEQEARRLTDRVRIVVQETPTGMGDAVEVGLAAVTTLHTAVAWGDQVALRRASVAAVMRIHAGPLAPAVTFPTVEREQPYIHFERDADGRISALRQAREGDPMPARGESDTGYFCFVTQTLRELLAESRSRGQRGAGTGEFNLLPVLVAAARSRVVLTPQVMMREETVGINAAPDAAQVEAFLRSERYASTEIHG